MKTALVRSFVVALALTGFSASTVVSHSQTAKKNVTMPKIGTAMPMPGCALGSGGVGCGW